MNATSTTEALPSHRTRTQIAQAQLDKLRGMLGQLRERNAFYEPRLAGARLDASVESIDAFTQRMPTTTKAELVDDQAAAPPFGTNLTYALGQYSRYFQTSGTTRSPLRWLDTPESWRWMLDCWDHVYDAAGVTAADRVLCAFSFGPFLGFWTAHECAARRGCITIPGGGMSSLARLRTIDDNRVTVLCCTPTYALRLSEVGLDEGIDTRLLGVRTIIVAGEPGGNVPATRQRIREAWGGARVVDHHGMTEIGPVTYGCPVCEGVLHVIETEYIAEVIDPVTFEPVGPGGAGELVLTNLGRVGSPLLRYRTGDRVRRASESVCACGRSELSLVGGIIGRADDMVIVRGVNLFPSAVEDIIRGVPDVGEFRVEIRTERAMSELRVMVEPGVDCGAPHALARRIENQLREAFALRIPVKTVGRGTLPRFEMKARRWIRLDD